MLLLPRWDRDETLVRLEIAMVSRPRPQPHSCCCPCKCRITTVDWRKGRQKTWSKLESSPRPTSIDVLGWIKFVMTLRLRTHYTVVHRLCQRTWSGARVFDDDDVKFCAEVQPFRENGKSLVRYFIYAPCIDKITVHFTRQTCIGLHSTGLSSLFMDCYRWWWWSYVYVTLRRTCIYFDFAFWGKSQR